MKRLNHIDQQFLRNDIPKFRAGDTLRVHLKITEGGKERVQVFEGICIKRHNDGINSTFTVRKVSYGVGVERAFPLHSPRIAEIEIKSKGRVRRAKLYYLRDLTGKAARIRELKAPQSKRTRGQSASK